MARHNQESEVIALEEDSRISAGVVAVVCRECGLAQVTAIKAGRLVDPQAGTVLTDQIILIRDNKIEQVGKGLAIPADAKVIDLSQMTVLPGLIDCHTHLADAPDEDGDPFQLLRKTAAQTALLPFPMRAHFLREGFTTVRDVGVYRALNDVAMRDAIAHGYIEGPRMYVAGAYMTITGGAGAMTGLAPDITLPWDLRYGEADSPWEVRQRIRQLVHDGADHIKVLSSGAVLTHGSNPKSQEFTPEELQAAVDEASHFGLRVAAHAHARPRDQECDPGRRGFDRARDHDRRRRHRAGQASMALISTWISTTKSAFRRRAGGKDAQRFSAARCGTGRASPARTFAKR